MTDAVIDWSDPCARAAALRDAYFRRTTGGAETEIRTRTLDGEEMVRFAQADIDTLRSELQDAEDACLRQQAGDTASTLPKRFAITCRHKRPRWGYPFRGRC